MPKFLDETGLAYLIQKLKSYIYAHSGGGGATSSNIPAGVIWIWSGSADNVPDGFALCNGENGTPDLRGRFVLGNSANHAVGSTGGSEEVTLTVEQMPEHNHANKNTNSTMSVSPSGSNSIYKANGNFVETINNFISPAGGSQPHPNMPPYYTLCYIMKL